MIYIPILQLQGLVGCTVLEQPDFLQSHLVHMCLWMCVWWGRDNGHNNPGWLSPSITGVKWVYSSLLGWAWAVFFCTCYGAWAVFFCTCYGKYTLLQISECFLRHGKNDYIRKCQSTTKSLSKLKMNELHSTSSSMDTTRMETTHGCCFFNHFNDCSSLAPRP